MNYDHMILVEILVRIFFENFDENFDFCFDFVTQILHDNNDQNSHVNAESSFYLF